MTHYYYCKKCDRVLVTRGANHFLRKHGKNLLEAEKAGLAIHLGFADKSPYSVFHRNPDQIVKVEAELRRIAGRGLTKKEKAF